MLHFDCGVTASIFSVLPLTCPGIFGPFRTGKRLLVNIARMSALGGGLNWSMQLDLPDFLYQGHCYFTAPSAVARA